MAKKQILSFWYVLLAAPTLVFVGIVYFVMKRIGGCMHGGMLKIGKSKARVCMQTETGVTFKDVAGIDEARARVSATLTTSPGRSQARACAPNSPASGRAKARPSSAPSWASTTPLPTP